MKLLLAALFGLVCCAWSGVASAQAANSGETCGLFGCAVSATLRAHAQANAWSDAEINDELSRMDAQVKADTAAIPSGAALCNDPSTGTSYPCGWFTWMWNKLANGLAYASGQRTDPLNRFFNNPNDPHCGGQINCATGGAGATNVGTWADGAQPDCAKYSLTFDQAGRLYVPTMYLQPGGQLHKELAGQYKAFNVYGDNVNVWETDTVAAAALWQAHYFNKLTSRPVWIGVWGINERNGTDFYENCQPREYVGGSLQGGPCGEWGNYNPNAYWGGADSQDCPDGTVTGGTFDFYLGGAGGSTPKMCVEYSPNSAIGKEGYAYPEMTVLPQGYQYGFPRGMGTFRTACPVSVAAIQAATQKLMNEASAAGGKANPGTIQPSEVKTGCAAPQVVDLQDSPAVPTTTNCNSAPPTTTTQPPPSSGGGGSSGGSGTITGDDPGISASDPTSPTNIMDPIFNWMPKLPQLTLNTSGATCPTWQLDLTSFHAGWQWTMDGQCTLAESVRSLLNSLMLVVWTIGAAVVILRA